MNLLYLASIDFPLVKARAIQIVNTCDALARSGCQVTLVVGRRDDRPIERHLARYGLTAHPNFRIVRVPAFRLPGWAPALLQPLYTRLWNWTYLAAVLALLPWLLRSGPTLLIRDYRLAWLLSKLSSLHNRRLVFEVHGLPSAELLDQHPPTVPVEREAARRRNLEQSVFDGAWRLLTITECLRDRLIRDYNVDPERVATVPDAAHAAVAGRAGCWERAEADAAMPSLIYVGQLYPWKGVDLLVRALPAIERADLTIVGGLEDDPEQIRLERLARDTGVLDRVRFLGSRPYAEVPALLAAANIALLPLAEGIVARCFTSPLKLFDYLAAGIPIVAVDFPTIREVLRDGENALLVPPERPDLLAAAVERLLHDPVLAARLAQQARHDAMDHTWERRAARIVAALAPGRAPRLATVR
jgi:glycosyltransferase involved in cell wall biosynthesis